MACMRKTKSAAPSRAVSTVFAVPDAAADPSGGAGDSGAQAEIPARTDAAPQTGTAPREDAAAQTDAASETDRTEAADASWTEVNMRRYVHPIPAACTAWGCQTCPCQSWAEQGAEETARLARLLRQQRALLTEIRDLLVQMFPYL